MDNDLLKEVAINLRNLADSLDKFALTSTKEEETPKKKNAKKVTLEEVRGVLATKSQEGKTTQVRELIQTFNATKLSDVKELDYAALKEQAKVL